MGIQFLKHLPTKKGLNSFALPLVLIVIIVLSLFIQEIFVLSSNRFLINKSLAEKELLNDVIGIGNKILEKGLIKYGTGPVEESGSFCSRIKENPKVYIDMNGDGLVDSVILFSFINISTTKIEYALTAYRLNREGCGKTDHVWTTMKMEPNSIRNVNILSNSFTTNTQISEYIQFSLKSVNSVYVLDKLILIKKLNLVSNG